MSEAAAPVCLYALVKQVQIEKVTKSELTFSTRSSAGKRESFTVAMSEILADPPTDAPEPVYLDAGKVGNLYLSEDGWDAVSSAGSTIYRKGDPNLVLFKWPWCSAYRILSRIPVIPQRIEVHGIDDAGNAIDVDLLSNDVYAEQEIDWNGAEPIQVTMADRTVKHVWPERMVFTGSAESRKEITASFDILDVTFGDFNQLFRWSERGQPFPLKLSTTAMGLLVVTPTAIENLARGLRVTYPHFVVKECDLLDHIKDEVIQRDIAQARANATRKEVGPATTSKRRTQG